jgi:hypothetical protein
MEQPQRRQRNAQRAAFVLRNQHRQQAAGPLLGLESFRDQIEERPPGRIDDDLDVALCRDLRAELGGHDRSVEPAELVHQAVRLCLAAGPDAALRDGVQLLGRHVPRLCGLLDELIVGLLDHALDFLALGVVERPHGRGQLGELALAHGLDVGAELRVDAAGHHLAGDDANRSGQRAGLRHDVRRGHCHPVAARCREIGHRDHERPIVTLVARDHQLAPDRV